LIASRRLPAVKSPLFVTVKVAAPAPIEARARPMAATSGEWRMAFEAEGRVNVRMVRDLPGPLIVTARKQASCHP
jgi:hypothetical protein